MANMLAAFGRAGVMEKASGMLGSISAYKQGQSRIALQEEQLAQVKRETQIADAEEARLNVKIDLQGKFEQFPGGKDGPIAQGAASFFKRRGLVDMELGAMGQVTQRAMGQFEEWIKTNPMELSQSVVKHLQVEYAKRDDINAQLKEKEGDKTLLEARQNVNLSIQQATEWVAGIKAETARRAEVKKASVLATAKKEAEDKKARELRVHQIAERLLKEDKQGPLTFEQRKELKGIGPAKDPKAGVNYLLKDRSMVTSFDGGRTFRDESGKNVKMPFDAVSFDHASKFFCKHGIRSTQR